MLISMEIKRVKSISLEDLQNQNDVFVEEKQEHKSLSKEEYREEKKKNRFYLPVLYINDPTVWEPKAKSERIHFTDEVAESVCLNNCCNVPGLRSACCRMDPDDLEHVLGPLDEKWIKKIIKWFNSKGIVTKREDIVIDFEEGKIIGEKFFNSKPVFMKEDSYPIMRFQIDGSHFSCKFLNTNTGKCQIYQERPDMCRNYLCQYVKSNFIVKKNNSWTTINPPVNDKL